MLMTMAPDERRDPAEAVGDEIVDLLRAADGPAATAALLLRILERVEQLETAVHSHADLFHSIGVLVTVLGVSPGDDPDWTESEGLRTPPAPRPGSGH